MSNYDDSTRRLARHLRRVSDEALNAGLISAIQEAANIVQSAIAALLSDATPQPLGTAAAGDDTTASRADHVHAHGDLGGGSLHAAATTSVAGFMAATDKVKSDAYPAISGLTTGHVLTATGASTAAFAAPPASGGPGALRVPPAALPATALGGASDPILINTTTHDAFPGLAVTPGGDLILVCREGSNHVGSKGVLRYRLSSDGGLTWGNATTFYSDATYDARDPSITRLRDGTLIVTFFLYDQGAGAGFTNGAKVIASSDGGATWGSVVALPSFSNTAAICGPIIELRESGYLLAPVYGSDDGSAWYTKIARSTNGGATWATLATVARSGKYESESTLAELSDGTLLIHLRNETDTQIDQATSSDGGATWTAPASVFAGQSRAALLVTRSGLLVAAYRQAGGGLVGYLRWSLDDGATWYGPYAATSGYYVYGALVEYAPGLIAHAWATESGSDADLRVQYFAEGNPAQSAYVAAAGDPALGGDLSGTASAATVEAVQGQPWATTAPTTGDVPTWDGAQWAPATPAAPSGGQYRQFAYTVGGGDITFLTDEDGSPIFILCDLE